jgi:ribosomal protein S18 acetylase RimI-like enzyme
VIEWTVREARPGDGEGLAALHADTGRGYVAMDPVRFRLPDTDGLATWFDEDLATVGDGWISYVAVADGDIVGQVEARLVPPIETARFQVVTALGETRGYVNSLAVRSSHRRQGIARSLMEAAERWLAEHGATVVELDTLASSPESVPFYRALGYRATKLIFERSL